MTEHAEITVGDGKYTVFVDPRHFHALRYNKPWRDLTGDNLVYFLCIRILELEERLAAALVDVPPITLHDAADNPSITQFSDDAEEGES